jgi:hypothetical protein
LALIKIDATHKDAVQKTAAIYGVNVEFYTNEKNPEMLTVDVQISDLEMMFYFAQGVQIEIETQREKKLESLYRRQVELINHALLNPNKP